MSATITWTVTQMDCYPQEGGETDVVFTVHWTCSGVQTEGETVYNGSERARIDSSGNFLLGNTSSYGWKAQFESASGTPTLYLGRDTTTTTDNVVTLSSSVGGAGTVRFTIAASGDVKNSNNSYGAISDAKLKENITEATPKLEKLQQVRVVNYNLIGETQKQIGVIAQELEQIFPGMVEETPDRDKEGNALGTTTKSVKYSVFVPMLIKAIQEQQAIITAQAAQIQQLREKVLEVEEGTSNMLVENTNNLYETITALTARVAALEAT